MGEPPSAQCACSTSDSVLRILRSDVMTCKADIAIAIMNLTLLYGLKRIDFNALKLQLHTIVIG